MFCDFGRQDLKFRLFLVCQPSQVNQKQAMKQNNKSYYIAVLLKSEKSQELFLVFTIELKTSWKCLGALISALILF